MSTRSAPVNEGDWICSNKDCGNINFTWRSRCNRCGKEKGKVDVFKKTGSEIGKSAAAKSGGLFSAEDWQCSKCGNVNWARRSTCNICNEPKFGKIEARTGLGGGYNERDEIIEYKDRDDSDGELDEFGRKKKKLRNLSQGQQPNVVDSRLEESEEEDSDEDISKYDLFGDDESDEKDEKSNSGRRDEERQSRSRSSSGERYRHHKHRSRSPYRRRSRSHSSSVERQHHKHRRRHSRSRSSSGERHQHHKHRSRSPRRRHR